MKTMRLLAGPRALGPSCSTFGVYRTSISAVAASQRRLVPYVTDASVTFRFGLRTTYEEVLNRLRRRGPDGSGLFKYVASPWSASA